MAEKKDETIIAANIFMISKKYHKRVGKRQNIVVETGNSKISLSAPSVVPDILLEPKRGRWVWLIFGAMNEIRKFEVL